MNRRHAILLITAAFVSRASAQARKANKFNYEAAIMGTRFAVVCHAEEEEQAARAVSAAFAEARRINDVASDYIADSELLQLSKHQAGEKIPISPLLFKLVSEARIFAEKTHGAFDPTLGPLTVLWREARRRKTLPDSPTLLTTIGRTGWKNLQLDASTSSLTFLKTGMRLDLGGIAKGQAADAMLECMRREGVPCCCITAGGDVRAGDAPPDSEGWRVGVRTEKNQKADTFLHLANKAVSTSGDLHQFIEINGVRYSHIIDPATGLGLTKAVAATVIAPIATTSDALATACCVAPAEEAKAMGMTAGAGEIFLW